MRCLAPTCSHHNRTLSGSQASRVRKIGPEGPRVGRAKKRTELCHHRREQGQYRTSMGCVYRVPYPSTSVVLWRCCSERQDHHHQIELCPLEYPQPSCSRLANVVMHKASSSSHGIWPTRIWGEQPFRDLASVLHQGWIMGFRQEKHILHIELELEASQSLRKFPYAKCHIRQLLLG